MSDLKLLYLHLFLVGGCVIINTFIPDLFLQIIRNSHKERFEIGNRGEVIVDPVGTGDQTHGHQCEQRKLWQNGGNLYT